ncbi:hypothetical protein Tco_0596363 [Tanacetum coccineum]
MMVDDDEDDDDEKARQLITPGDQQREETDSAASGMKEDIQLGRTLTTLTSKCRPLRGPPGSVTIQATILLNKDLDYRYSTRAKNAFTYSKLKSRLLPRHLALRLVPSLWVESEREYDISAVYGITHCSGLKLSNTDQLNVLVWDAADYITSKKTNDRPLSQEQLSTETINDQRKLMRLNEHYKLVMGRMTRVNGKAGPNVKTFICTSTIKGMRLGQVVRG